ncbi:hypothetical protein BGW41_002974 [Actinomortierella wolfii]|nr:hypothetical protein BGW41_002974 [Actinomortierella wolfii]
MTCYLSSQCVPLQYLCDPALEGEDCDHSEDQAPLTCGPDRICYSTNNQLPYPSPGKGAPSASQCDDGYFVALVGDKYTRSCLIRTSQPASKCRAWEYSYRGYCLLSSCNATAPCAGDFECRPLNPSSDTGVCRHPSDHSDSAWPSSSGNGETDDDDDSDEHYSSQDMLMEGLLISTSSIIFGGLVGACFWYYKRRRERRIQWEREGHGTRQASGSLSAAILGTDGGGTKGTRFLPSWIERRWRSQSPQHNSPDERRDDTLEEDGHGNGRDSTSAASAAVMMRRSSSSNDRRNAMDDGDESRPDTRFSYIGQRQYPFSSRRWFWQLDGGFGGQQHRQPPVSSTVIGMLDIAPELDPPPAYTRRPDSGLPAYVDVTGESQLGEHTISMQEEQEPTLQQSPSPSLSQPSTQPLPTDEQITSIHPEPAEAVLAEVQADSVSYSIQDEPLSQASPPADDMGAVASSTSNAASASE